MHFIVMLMLHCSPNIGPKMTTFCHAGKEISGQVCLFAENNYYSHYNKIAGFIPFLFYLFLSYFQLLKTLSAVVSLISIFTIKVGQLT